MMCINDTSETLDWEKKNPAGWQVFSVDSEALHLDTQVGGLCYRPALRWTHLIPLFLGWCRQCSCLARILIMLLGAQIREMKSEEALHDIELDFGFHPQFALLR